MSEVDIATAIQAVTAVVVAVWVVAQVKASTSKLGTNIEHLASEINRLERTVAKLDSHVSDHEVRIRLIEAGFPHKA